MFENRQHAGKLLTSRLRQVLDQKPMETVVVGLPRGGVPLASEIAVSLHCAFDILVSKKIQSPDNPEFAIGAVSSGGTVIFDGRAHYFPVTADRYAHAQRIQKDRLVVETREQEERLIAQSGIKNRPSLDGKRVILVDDGIATGMTTRAALQDLKMRGVKERIVATPVVPYETYIALKSQCEMVVALLIPVEFTAVGRHYVDFHQVSDKEVLAAMRQAVSLPVGKALANVE